MQVKLKDGIDTLCRLCENGTVITPRRGGTPIVHCAKTDRPIREGVSDCTSFQDRTKPGQNQWELEKIAWILDESKKGAKVIRGFTSPAERRNSRGILIDDV